MISKKCLLLSTIFLLFSCGSSASNSSFENSQSAISFSSYLGPVNDEDTFTARYQSIPFDTIYKKVDFVVSFSQSASGFIVSSNTYHLEIEEDPKGYSTSQADTFVRFKNGAFEDFDIISYYCDAGNLISASFSETETTLDMKIKMLASSVNVEQFDLSVSFSKENGYLLSQVSYGYSKNELVEIATLSCQEYAI